MKHEQGSVNLSNWNLESAEKVRALLDGMVSEAASEAVKLAIDSDDTYAFLPAEWGDSDGCGGPRCDDPLTIYFRIALGNGDEEDPIWKTSLRAMLNDTIETCAKDGSWADGLARIRDALRELANSIDSALPPNVADERKPPAAPT